MKKNRMILLTVIVAAVLICAAAFALAGGSSRQETGESIAISVQNTEATDLVETEQESDVLAAEDDMQEEVFQVEEIYGTVLEVTDAYILMETDQSGKVQANISEDTVLEGAESVEIGQVIKVVYDGMMTRSLPAQINAMLIGVYAVSGEVTEIAESSMVIRRNDTQEEVVITFEGSEEEIAVGDVVTAYTNGISTMSLPPQMNAIAIVK
ncbi:MAG: hypothetical protein IJ381_05385 [Clostridia bacterium]|nr:hypothetical protein [Clostridia bacterium]